MDFESDPAFDGSGVLAVQVFDTPNPPSENADAVALYSRLWPADIENDEIEITALPSPRVVVPNAPSTVYVRVFFADNPAIFDEQDLVAGTWVGGFDLGDGLAEGVGLEPVTIEPGQGKELEVPLIAFRRFDVTVNVSATPLGNGQGPLGVAAVRNANAAGEPPIFGLVEAGCVDAADAPFSTTGALIGSGDFFVTGILYDFGDTEDLAPGSLSSLDVDFEQNTATIPTRISVGARDYSASATIDLDFVAPMVADGGAPADTTCSGDAPDGGS